MKRRVATLVGVLAAIGVGAGIALIVLFNTPGGSIGARLSNLGADIRDYIADQIIAIVNSHLEPRIEFESIDYDAPGTVTLAGVTLTAPDGTRVVDVDSMTIELAEIPSTDKPITIERIVIDSGRVNIETDPETGAVKGLMPLIRRSGREAGARATPDVPAENVRLSNVFRLRLLEVRDLDVSIDDASGAPPMLIEGFTATMNVAPSTGADQDAPTGDGWYRIDLTSGRSPGLELDAAGWFNIDTLTADLRQGAATLSLDDQTVSSLPQRLADFARRHEFRGNLNATFSGTLPVRDFASGNARASVTVNEFSFATADRRFPVESLNLDAALSAGSLSVTRLHAEAIDGVIDATASADLTASGLPGRAGLTFEGLQLERLLRYTSGEGAAPELAGLMRGRVEATFNLSDPAGTIAGDGELHVRDGVLVTVPGLKQLAEVAKIASFGVSRERSHKADIVFNIEPGRFVVTESEITTPSLGARGTGSIGFDQTLDLRVNAGPLEKLQSMLGKAGELLGAITDKLAAYLVRGTLSDPKVTVAPLGIGG